MAAQTTKRVVIRYNDSQREVRFPVARSAFSVSRTFYLRHWAEVYKSRSMTDRSSKSGGSWPRMAFQLFKRYVSVAFSYTVVFCYLVRIRAISWAWVLCTSVR